MKLDWQKAFAGLLLLFLTLLAFQAREVIAQQKQANEERIEMRLELARTRGTIEAFLENRAREE